jgi:hypothetical protein
MANFKDVNRAIRKEFPNMDIEVVRGEGYVYFSGDDVDGIDSIYTHPVSTSTSDVIRLCVFEIEHFLGA